MKGNKALPLVWNKQEMGVNELPNLLATKYEDIKKELSQSGAILFKSFNINTASKLESCVQHFPGNPLNYVDGNSPRTRLQGKVYTSTEHPSDAFISLHNELSYSHKWPKYLFFCCEEPAEEGGYTLIADGREIYDDLSPRLKVAFEQKGIRYIRNLHGGSGLGPSWQETFETDSREQVQDHCMATDIEYEWSEDNSLRLIQRRAPFLKHKETNEIVWFNQADQFHPSTNEKEVYEALMEIYEGRYDEMPQYVCFDDGSEIPIEMFEEIRKVTEKNTVEFPWERGDLLLVDNELVAHGRSPYKGFRKILVAMSN